MTRERLASFFASVAAVSVAVLAAWAQQAQSTTVAHTDDLVAQLCAKGADPGLCAQAGKAQIRYVMTGPVAHSRWPQFAEPAR